MSSSRVKGLNILLDIVVLLTDTCTCCLYTHNGVGCLTAIVPTVRINCVESGQQSRAEQIRADLAAHHTADCEVQAAEHFVLQYGISNTVSTCQQRKLLRYALYRARAGKNRTGSWRKGSICNRYWSGKSNIYYILCVGVCVFVALVVRHAMRMRRIVICGLPGSATFPPTLSHKRHDFRGQKIYLI